MVGSVSVKSDTSVTPNRKWATFYRYDGQGRLVMTANPSAVQP